MKPEEIEWAYPEEKDGLYLSDGRELCEHWRCLALQAREEIAGLKAQLLWTGDRLRERIRELEGVVEDLTESNDTWLEVAAKVGRELDIVPDVAIATAPERIRELKAELERLKGHGEKWPFR